MPGQAAKVQISERQQTLLQELRRSRSESPMISQRAKIILLAFEGHWNEEIAIEVGLERKQVGVWRRRRCQEAWDALTLLECTEPRKLRDAPRSGYSGKFTVARDPNGEWIFIVDTLNIHWSAGLVEWGAQRCKPETDLGKKGQLGILKTKRFGERFCRISTTGFASFTSRSTVPG